MCYVPASTVKYHHNIHTRSQNALYKATKKSLCQAIECQPHRWHFIYVKCCKSIWSGFYAQQKEQFAESDNIAQTWWNLHNAYTNYYTIIMCSKMSDFLPFYHLFSTHYNIGIIVTEHCRGINLIFIIDTSQWLNSQFNLLMNAIEKPVEHAEKW